MKRGLISRIQRYSTKDGPGIRSTVFMQGCNLRCLWCANPETLSRSCEVFYYKDRCKQCGLCVNAADNQAISFAEQGVNIDRKKCSNLIDIVEVCPYDAYEKVGMELSSKELADLLLRDDAFYETSGGGVTFSGGEAALQAPFLLETAQYLKQSGVHVCLDTAGHIRWDKLSPLMDVVDLVSYDIKAISSDIHRDCTGVPSELILENAQKIASLGKPMLVRMVIVPTCNDQLEDIHNRINFIASLGKAVQQLDLLEYHIYGIGKYEKLGMDYQLNDLPHSNPEITNQIKAYAENAGLKVTLGG